MWPFDAFVPISGMQFASPNQGGYATPSPNAVALNAANQGSAGGGPVPSVVTQLSPVDANAGNQFTQIVGVNAPSTSSIFAGGAANAPTGQTGPGWATPSGGSTSPSPASTATATTWYFWLFIAALAYFGGRG